MEKISKALLVSMSYFELWDDDVIDPDIAVGALESISAELKGASNEEREIIAKAANELALQSTSEEVREFFEEFVESFGLDD